MNERMDRWVGRRMNRGMDGWTDGWMNGYYLSDGWMDGYYLGGWDRPGETYIHHLHRLALKSPKSSFKVQLYRATLSN